MTTTITTLEAQLVDALEPIYRKLAERGLPPFADDMAGLRARLQRLHIRAMEQAGIRHLDAAESAERCRDEAKRRAFALAD